MKAAVSDKRDIARAVLDILRTAQIVPDEEEGDDGETTTAPAPPASEKNYYFDIATGKLTRTQ